MTHEEIAVGFDGSLARVLVLGWRRVAPPSQHKNPGEERSEEQCEGKESGLCQALFCEVAHSNFM